MKFCNFLLRVGGIREASLEDFRQVLSKGNRTYKPERQKYLYSIDEHFDPTEVRALLLHELR